MADVLLKRLLAQRPLRGGYALLIVLPSLFRHLGVLGHLSLAIAFCGPLSTPQYTRESIGDKGARAFFVAKGRLGISLTSAEKFLDF
jgi:hypothetical protein